MIGVLEIILLAIIFLLLIPLVALIHLLKNEFKENDKLIWLLVILFFPVFGSILYFTIGKNPIID
jgi:hypothetical protein